MEGLIVNCYEDVQRGDAKGRLVFTEKQLAFYTTTTSSSSSTSRSDFTVPWNKIAKHYYYTSADKPMLKLVNHQEKALRFTMGSAEDLERVKRDVKDRLQIARTTATTTSRSTTTTTSTTATSSSDRQAAEAAKAVVNANANAIAHLYSNNTLLNNSNNAMDPSSLNHFQSLMLPSKLGVGSVVMASVIKAKGDLVGLILGHSQQDRHQRLCIVKIARSSLFQDTALQVGMELLFINDQSCQNMEATQAANLIQQASGRLVVVARVVPKRGIREAPMGASIAVQQRSVKIQLGML